MNTRTGWTVGWALALTIAFTLLTLTPPAATAAPKNYRIELPTRTLEPAPDGGAYLNQRDASAPEQLLIQFHDHPTAAERRTMKAAGVHLQHYTGGGAWVAYVEPGVRASAIAGRALRWVGPTLAEDRIAPRVTAQELPSWAAAGDEILVSVQFADVIDDTEGEVRLRRQGATVGDYLPTLNAWYVQVPERAALALANDPAVLAIDYIAPPMMTVNAGARAAMNVDQLYDPPLELRGAGTTVCVYDGGIADINHPDFEDRGIIGENGGTSDHATHVMGTVGGNGADPYRGMAPEATLISYEYESCNPNCLYDSPQDIFENYQEAWLEYGARIFTNSIGANIYANGYPCDWQGDYEITSALIDGIVRGDLGVPVIVGFAAGNERGGGPCGDAYETLTVPAGAKNIITVGATDDNDGNASFTSWGPPDDGRVKPTVMAPGVGLQSCRPGGGYQSMSGTSMATPAVAGVNALLTEAWGRWATTDFPRPATVKALLVNGAEDLWNPGPDYRNGWGRVDAARSVEMIETFGYLESSVGNNGVVNHSFNVPGGLDQLKVSIAWSDFPAPYLPAITLINDLDMLLVSPGGTEYQPFVLDWNNPGNPATTGVNVRDVVEQVVVANPQAGQWTLRVNGTDVPLGPQNFSAAANVPLAAGVTIVQGTVSDSNSGQGLEGAVVGLDGSGGGEVTDVNGDYFMYLPVSEATAISASLPGYGTLRQYVLPGEDVNEIDFALTARPGGTVTGGVFDISGNGVAGATVTVAELTAEQTVTDADGLFTMELPSGSALRLIASDGIDTGYGDVFVYEDDVAAVDIVLASPEFMATGPDEHGYVAVQSGDAHPMAMPYDWVEIDPDQGGSGTRITTSEEEATFVIDLGFTFYYYGRAYDQITVNENGFFSFGDNQRLGNDVAGDYSNSPIPDPDGPPSLVGPFWEDFRANETNLSYWHDTVNHRFILEWYDSRQWPNDGTRETFQVILFEPAYDIDPAFYLPGIIDGRILFQYADVNDLSNATVGIENHTQEDGVQILYFDTEGNGSYAETAATITDASTLLFYRPMAVAAGQVALAPANDDLEITVSGPLGQTVADANGIYILPVPPGYSEMHLSAPGYEHRVVGVAAGDWSIREMDNLILSALQPPLNLTWTFGGGNVTLNWNAPGGNVADFLDSYRVYKQGAMMGETDQTSWVDTSPVNPPLYWVTAMYAGGESDSSGHAQPGFAASVAGDGSLLPDEFEIGEAYPNPFNPSTSVKVALPEASAVKVAVYDVLGREVATLISGQRMPAGYHTLSWQADGQASGVYFLHVEAGPLQAVRKLVLLK